MKRLLCTILLFLFFQFSSSYVAGISFFSSGHVYPVSTLLKQMEKDHNVSIAFLSHSFEMRDVDDTRTFESFNMSKKVKSLGINTIDCGKTIFFDNERQSYEKDVKNRDAGINDLNDLGSIFLLGEMIGSLFRNYKHCIENLEEKPELLVYESFSIFGAVLAKEMGIPAVMIQNHPVWSGSFNEFFPQTPSFGSLEIVPIRNANFFQRCKYSFQHYSSKIFTKLFLLKRYYDTCKNFGVSNEECLPSIKDIVSKFGQIVFVAARPFTYFSSLPFGVYDLMPFISEEDKKKSEDVENFKDLFDWINQSELPIIYVSFGTLTHPIKEYYLPIVNGLLEGCQNGKLCKVIWANGKDLERIEEENLSNEFMNLYGFVPQKAILRHEKVLAFISHCGMGSGTEAFASNIHVFTTPQTADQYTVASSLIDMGIGTNILDENNKPSKKKIIEAVKKVVTSPTDQVTVELKKAKALYDLNGGVEKAAEICYKYMQFERTVIEAKPFKGFRDDWNFIQRNSIDVVLVFVVLAVAFLLLVVIIFKIVKKVFCCCICKSSKKKISSKKKNS